MRAWRNHELVYVAGIVLALASVTTQAAFAISRIDAVATKRTLTVSGQIKLAINHQVDDAITRGIPLDVELELRLYRERPIIWADHVATWVVRRQIRYHALSGQYYVVNQEPRPVRLENFATLRHALGRMGTLRNLKLKLPAPLQKNSRYKLEMRVALDIESLPSPMRPFAYASLAWHLNSGWTTWIVQH